MTVAGKLGVWKYVRYWDNPMFHDAIRRTAPDAYELYCLSDDPHEQTNLAWPKNETAASKEARKKMTAILNEERKAKRLASKLTTAQTPKLGARFKRKGKGKTWLVAR